MTDPTTINLFCGAGGMSTGFKQAGFDIIAAIDNDGHAVRTFETNHPDVQHVLRRSLERNDLNPRELEETIGLSTIDLLIGGPPCQGFSLASMNPNAKATFGPNKHKRDSRNSLYRRFFDYIEHFKPSVFVMENVPTLRRKTNGYYETQIEKLAKKLEYGVSFWKLNAADYGVPQTRTRLFVIGFTDNMEMQIPAPTNSSEGKNLPKHITVREAILDLPPLKAGDGSDVMSYEVHQRGSHKSDSKRSDNYARWVRNNAKELRHHQSRPHSKRDLSIFKLLRPGKTSAQ
jgi:DNA (cytosine-5)-methyltransferase 1